MGQPKKRTSARRTGMRRSHLMLKLARAVNAKSPVKAHTTVRKTGTRKKARAVAAETKVKTAKKAEKPKATQSKTAKTA